ELLQDNGYSTKLLPDRALNTINATGGTCLNVIDTANNPALYYDGHSGIANPNAFNELLTPMLVVVSGSGSSADVAPQNTLGIPIVCGESAVIGGTSTGPSRSEERRVGEEGR